MTKFRNQTRDEEAMNRSTSLLPAILLIGLVAVAGSLWLSIGMGLKACPLCFYQRSFVMGVVAVLVMGLATGLRVELVVLTLPLAIAGLCVAVFHVLLEFSGKLECPAGILGLGTAPQQSLAILSMLAIAIIAQGFNDVLKDRGTWLTLLGGAILGGLIAYGSIASAPPLPNAPTNAYEVPMDTCRTPFQEVRNRK